MRSLEPPAFLALYGSLRHGQPPHARLGLDRLLRLVGPCKLKGTLHDFGDWPGLVEGEEFVTGELYEIVDEGALKRLDEFEASDEVRPDRGLFVRRLVLLAAPVQTRAFVYFYNRDPADAPVVAGGDWVEHLRAREAR